MTQQSLNLANDRQVGGNHYKKRVLEHWDTVVLFNLDYFQGNAWKYLLRWRDKAGIQDLEKCQHYVQKYIEVEKARASGTLTRQILESAIRELEGIEAQDDYAAMYRAQAKGDDPVGDALSGYPRNIDGAPLEVGDIVDIGDGLVVTKHRQCSHGDGDCKIHPNGGCPPARAPAAMPA